MAFKEPKKCKEPGCNSYAWARGFCAGHANKKKQPKKPNTELNKTLEALAAIVSKKPSNMANRSTINQVTLSDGTKISAAEYERRISAAKGRKKEEFFHEHWRYFCEQCGRNDRSGQYIDMSHDISVSECKNNPDIPSELAYDVTNITLRCRPCHKKHDNM